MNLKNNSKWLFKYMPFNFNAVKIIANNELWFGKPDTQNDPNESEFILKNSEIVNPKNDFKIVIQEELDAEIEYLQSGSDTNLHISRIESEKKLKKVIRDYLGICSMSTIYNDILMWAHYSDNNKGICLVFDKEILTKNIGGDASKVTYSKNISNANLIKRGNIGQILSDKIFYMDKLINWEYESEFRFVKRFNDRIPQNEIDRLKSFPENALVGVILGGDFPEEDFKTLINLVYSRNNERDFYFWKCIKNLHKQSMDMTKITDEDVNIYLSQDKYLLKHILKDTKSELRNLNRT